MARKRSLDPEIWTDDRVQSLPSTTAVLFYIGTISHADDEGRIEWNARQLLGKIFPLRDDVKARDVEIAMEAVSRAGLVRVYEVNLRQYALHPSWRKHQYVNRPSPSKFPEPPTQLALNGSLIGSVNGSGNPQVPLESDSESVSESDSDLHGGKRAAAPPAWVLTLREATDAMSSRTLASLSATERFELAMRHSLEFGHCTKAEAKNRSRSRSVATGLANLTDRLNRANADLTVADYLRAARRVYELGGGKAWFRPFDVVAQLRIGEAVS